MEHCRIGLYLLTVTSRLKQFDKFWQNYDIICIISRHKCKELEVIAKWQTRNFSVNL